MILKTKILKNTKANIKLTANLLREDSIVGIPTETVYGLGGRGDSDKVIKKIYKIKKRPFDKPLILNYKDSTLALNDLNVDERAKELAKKFWPGLAKQFYLGLAWNRDQPTPGSTEPSHKGGIGRDQGN